MDDKKPTIDDQLDPLRPPADQPDRPLDERKVLALYPLTRKLTRDLERELVGIAACHTQRRDLPKVMATDLS